MVPAGGQPPTPWLSEPGRGHPEGRPEAQAVRTQSRLGGTDLLGDARAGLPPARLPGAMGAGLPPPMAAWSAGGWTAPRPRLAAWSAGVWPAHPPPTSPGCAKPWGRVRPRTELCPLADRQAGPPCVERKAWLQPLKIILLLILNITLLQAKKTSGLNHTLSLFFNEFIVVGSVRMQQMS